MAVSSSTAEASGNAAADMSMETELLQAFYEVPTIDKAWASSSASEEGWDVMVASTQLSLQANAKKSFVSSVHVVADAADKLVLHWSPFPTALSCSALLVPSPSGRKLLVVRNGEEEVSLEVWGRGQMLQEIVVDSKLHGSVYADGWFEGVSWSQDEEQIAYAAGEAAAGASTRPVFGTKSSKYDAGTWKGQGDWEEDWGESYTGKRRPVLFVARLSSGTVVQVPGIPSDLSAGQVVWSHADAELPSLVFVGWPSHSSNFKTRRKLGMKYCYNRPCALYTVAAPAGLSSEEKEAKAVRLTDELGSAFSPTLSPDGKQLFFLSAKSAVDTGVHCSTISLHSLRLPPPAKEQPAVRDVVPVVKTAPAGQFPGLYCLSIVAKPWLPDGSTLLLASTWRSMQVILAVHVDTGEVKRISPPESTASWSLLGVHQGYVIATSTDFTTPAILQLGRLQADSWSWKEVPQPGLEYKQQVQASLSSTSFQILQVPVQQDSIEAILVSAKPGAPLIVLLHGGPHSVTLTSFSRPWAFLSALGFNLLHVNYRGSLGFGEQALQSLPGNAGKQDVEDVLAALEQVVAAGLADPAKVAVLGGSHGGFLATHLIGQAPHRFRTAAVRNPVTNISSMVGITDIPDWCFVEAMRKDRFSEAPSAEDLARFYRASPIAHLEQVKVPSLFLLGSRDRRVPASNGFQYVHALRQRGLEVKVIVFPDDIHSIDKPRSDFESFVNIGAWFRRFLL